MTDTRAKLRNAAVELIAERGFRGATTKLIAERAGVNEVTLFRHFGNKYGLVLAAFRYSTKDINQVVSEPSGDLEGDLVRLARAYTTLTMSNRGAVTRLIPEMHHNEIVKNSFGKLFDKAANDVIGLFEYYVKLGELKKDNATNLAMAFLGPMLTRVFLSHLLEDDSSFDIERYVQDYLYGRSARNKS